MVPPLEICLWTWSRLSVITIIWQMLLSKSSDLKSVEIFNEVWCKVQPFTAGILLIKKYFYTVYFLYSVNNQYIYDQ